MAGKKPVALIILDGWGIAPDSEGNAVTRADTPYMDSLFAQYPSASLECYGEAVGLPHGQMGNSEVGHLNLGSGRVVHQDISRINLAVKDGSIRRNPAISRAMQRVKDNNSTLHFMGLMSDGGVHSLMTHLFALIDMAGDKGLAEVAVHSFLDGRDTPPDSGAGYLEELEDFLVSRDFAFSASVGGRFWGMDRDKRWDRVQKAYDALVRGKAPLIGDVVSYVKSRYAEKEYDEFVTPAVVKGPDGKALATIKDGDAIIFFNFRGDRARELSWVFNQPGFDGFDASDRPRLCDYVCMTTYDEHLGAPVAFPPEAIENTLALTVSKAGLKQLHIAETEKYAHVTFFFNGGEEEPVPGEDRILIPSPSEVATYDQKPSMSAPEVTEEILKRLAMDKYDLIIVNYANGDMVGHTGVFQAAKQAMETVDSCLARVIPAILAKGGKVLLTADHGNAEQMIDFETGGPYTAHTVSNPVPVLLIGDGGFKGPLNTGALCDVAPTLLALLGLEQPLEMTGTALTSREA